MVWGVVWATLWASVQCRLLVDSTLGLSEVEWSPERTFVFLGSPSLVRIPNGTLVASHDRFGHGGTEPYRTVYVYSSHDDGITWGHVGVCPGQYWSNLFMDGHKLYLLGTASDQPSGIDISVSTDWGLSWNTSQLFSDGGNGSKGYNTGPTPTIQALGYWWRAVERYRPPYRWGIDYEAQLLRAPIKSNLLDPSSWTRSKYLPFNEAWIPKNWKPKPIAPAYLEGNAVLGPDGKTMYNLLRFESHPMMGNVAVLLRYDDDTNSLIFDQFVNLPGGHTKFVVRKDGNTGWYVTLSNPNTVAKYVDQRNILSMCVSPDLRSWYEVATLLEDDTGFTADYSARYTGFHYVDWHFDGPDGENIVYLIRTAYRGANSYHNSNRITFKGLHQFSSFIPVASPHIVVKGYNFTLQPFVNNETAFSDRTYTWQGIPDGLFSNYQFCRIPGGAGPGTVSITADVQSPPTSRGGAVLVLSTPDNTVLIQDGWRMAAIRISYTDAKHTTMVVYTRPVTAAGSIPIPQHGWQGTVLLVHK